MRRLQRQELLLRSAITVACALVLLLLGGLYYTAVLNRATLREVRSCTTPQGECYQRGQDGTGAAVDSINRVVIYAALCADKPGYQSRQDIEECVLDLLEEKEKE